MTFDWSTYVLFAGDLLNRPVSADLEEAKFRSCVSRSYYGVFCIARNLLVRNRVPIPIKDTHNFVISYYEYSMNPPRKEIGTKLRRLWKERKSSDYADTAVIDLRCATMAYSLAERTLSALKSLGAR